MLIPQRLITLITLFVLGLNYSTAQTQTTKLDTVQDGLKGSVNPLNDQSIALLGQQLLDDSFSGSWPLFGTDVRMKIGGYVKGDVIQDFDYVGDRFEFELGSIAVEGTPERDLGGATTLHAKQSRVNFDFRSVVKRKDGKEFPLQVFVEVDWFFDDDAFRLSTRLRHAYGVVGRFLVGQTWTNSADLSTVPATIDFAGGDALYGSRVAQVRWQDKISERWTYTFALEDPVVGQVDNPTQLEGRTRPKWPKIVGAARYSSPIGSSIKFGLDTFPVNWSGSSEIANQSTAGYSLTINSRIVLKNSASPDAIVWGGGIGKGQGGQIVALEWDGKGAGVVTPDGIQANPAYYAFLGFNHYWSKSLNSNFSTAWAGIDLDNTQADTTLQSAGSVHANLIWFPTDRVSTGIEYMWGMRENKDGAQGIANRVQFMAKFKFN